MQITESYIHIPPYISTTWNGVQALWKEDELLCILLINKQTIEIAGLSSEEEEQIFAFHKKHLAALQGSTLTQPLREASIPSLLAGNPIGVQFGLASAGGMQNIMEHNASMSHFPDLPKELLQKIAKVASLLTQGGEGIDLPEAEPHCNCPHCQLARVMQGQWEQEQVSSEEEEEKEKLSFSDWHIENTEKNLYQVTHKLHPEESYSVHLGNPMGCTCGQTGCEHLIAVLRN
jgi:hypothetical protein